jgi:thioredoxin reductase (NADPH)
VLDFKLRREPERVSVAPSRTFDIIIIGGGPAGLTAGLYSARAGLSTLIIERRIPGGQASTTAKVENCPGCVEGSGPEIMAHLLRQGTNFGLELLYAEAESVDLRANPKVIVTNKGEVRGRAVIVATGASPTELGIKGEREFRGRGVSFCSTCDGAFFKDKDIVVIGGGDSALKEADYLTRFARKVIILHRREGLRAERGLQRRIENNPKIEIRRNTVVEEIIGRSFVEAIRVRNAKTGQTEEIPVAGVFEYVGTCPNTDLFAGNLELDARGYLIVDSKMATAIPGVFVAGDARQAVLRQVVTAMADGAVAATSADHWLVEQTQEPLEVQEVGR